MADNLLSRPMLRNARKHMRLCAHRKPLLFENCSTFPLQKILSCILMCNCVYVGCRDKNLPANGNAWRSVFTYTLSHISAHVAKVKYRRQTAFAHSHMHTRSRTVGWGEETLRELSVNPSSCEIAHRNSSIPSLAISHLTKPNPNTESALKI